MLKEKWRRQEKGTGFVRSFMGLESTLEIGGICCVEQTAGNTLEYGKKYHLYLCSALCFSKATINANNSKVSG